jgi:hypothetical protein
MPAILHSMKSHQCSYVYVICVILYIMCVNVLFDYLFKYLSHSEGDFFLLCFVCCYGYCEVRLFLSI